MTLLIFSKNYNQDKYLLSNLHFPIGMFRIMESLCVFKETRPIDIFITNNLLRPQVMD